MIKAILFDLDNTLVNRNISIRKMHEMLVDEDFPNLHHDARSSILDALRQWDYYGFVSHENVLRCYVKTYDVDRSIKDTATYIRMHQGDNAEVLPHAIEVLEALAPHYKLALVTNGSEYGQNLKIDTALGSYRNLFDTISIGGALNIQKPDPRIYAITCKALGVEPRECLFIGDDLINDIRIPLELGMKAIRVNISGMPPTTRVPEITTIQDLLTLDFEQL